MSNRNLITSAIINSLKRIDGRTSPYNASYEFKTDVRENVYKGFVYIDEINDFPSIYVTSGSEQRIYNTNKLTEAVVSTAIRCYIYGADSQQQVDNIISDVEHVIYSYKLDTTLQIQDITIKEILTDSGLLEPYGMAEIFLTTRFEIFDN
jgi:hypothetical protein